MTEIFSFVSAYLSGYPLLQALAIFVLFFSISKLLVFVAERLFLKLAKKTATKIDDLIIEHTNRPLSLILLLVGLRLGIIPLGLSEKITNYSELALYALIVLLVARIIIVIVDILIDNWLKKWAEKTKSRIDENLLSIFHRFSKFVFYIIAVLVVLDGFGVEIGPLLASLGIAGIAIAFALQNTLGNVFGGISLIVDKSIKVGDKVQIDPETIGVVHDIGLRSTQVRTYNNEIVIVPNGKLVESKIVNFAQPDASVRVVAPFSVAYGTNIEKLEKIVLAELKKVEHFIKEPEPFIRFEAMGDFALNFKAFFWIDSYENSGKALSDANALMYKAFSRNKIEIPYPQ